MDDFHFQFEPLATWPLTETVNRRGPQFKASYDQTLRDLKVELRHLGVTGAVAIQVVTKNGHTDLRRDGMLMARASITHPGVRLSFESKHGSLTYSSDRYEARYYGQASWQANLRAIVLSLEALRAVDRYGVSGSGEQYRGWQQLAARTSDSAGMSRDIALAVLREESGLADVMADLGYAKKLAVKAAHPDHNEGDDHRWNALRAALDALGLSL